VSGVICDDLYGEEAVVRGDEGPTGANLHCMRRLGTGIGGQRHSRAGSSANCRMSGAPLGAIRESLRAEQRATKRSQLAATLQLTLCKG